ncbi:MAG: hypothetical protein HY291_04740 [Planctomycetes bacterium]|nr:hypothetical protein [Planctomycetota bacterium]
MNTLRWTAALLFLTAAALGAEEPAAPKPAAVKIAKEDLKRLAVPRSEDFPWTAKAAVNPPAVVKPPTAAPNANQNSGMLNMAGGDTKVSCFGPFMHAVVPVDKIVNGKPAKVDKEQYTLTTDLKRYPNKVVEIEQTGATPDETQILRGQNVKSTMDPATGQMELLEANGNVEIYTKERKARGDNLLFETEYGPNQEMLKNQITVNGNREANRRATVWSGDDKVQAYRFEINMRLDTFRALGSPIAELNAAQATPPAGTPAPDAPKPAGGMGMLPGLSLAGGKVLISSDGELYYEGAAGRVKVTRNVAIVKEGLKMVSDEMLILMQVDDQPPAPGGQAAPGGGGVFSGSLKTMDCTGRIEIITSDQVIHCDHMYYDLQKERLRLEMKDPDDEVKIYSRDTSFPNEVRGTQVMVRKKRMDIETSSGTIVDLSDKNTPAQPMSIKPFTGLIPSPRGRQPASSKTQPETRKTDK